jgi:hypothetical protein
MTQLGLTSLSDSSLTAAVHPVAFAFGVGCFVLIVLQQPPLNS